MRALNAGHLGMTQARRNAIIDYWRINHPVALANNGVTGNEAKIQRRFDCLQEVERSIRDLRQALRQHIVNRFHNISLPQVDNAFWNSIMNQAVAPAIPPAVAIPPAAAHPGFAAHPAPPAPAMARAAGVAAASDSAPASPAGGASAVSSDSD